jgi:hypothetical protein
MNQKHRKSLGKTSLYTCMIRVYDAEEMAPKDFRLSKMAPVTATN